MGFIDTLRDWQERYVAQRLDPHPHVFKPPRRAGLDHGVRPSPPKPKLHHPTPKPTTTVTNHRHRRFVKRVHAFRIPLSPAGQRVAQVVYFSLPVIGGYFIMDWATSKAREEIEFGGGGDRSDRSSSGGSGSRPNAVAGKEDPARVLGNMRIDPRAQGRAVEQEGIRAQNEAMQKYLQSLKAQGQQQRP